MENIDKTLLKKLVKEIIMEDQSLLKEIVKEILIENEVIVVNQEAERQREIEKMIKEDFEKYDEVFKALA